jgi:hypothetical protein
MLGRLQGCNSYKKDTTVSIKEDKCAVSPTLRVTATVGLFVVVSRLRVVIRVSKRGEPVSRIYGRSLHLGVSTSRSGAGLCRSVALEGQLYRIEARA